MAILKFIKYITVMIHDDAPKIYGLDEIQKDQTVTLQKVPLTAHSFATRLLCVELMMSVVGALAILFGYMITNHVIEKLSTGSNVVSTTRRVVIWPSSYVEEKDINDMVMSGLDVQSVVESNTYHGLEAKPFKFTTWKKI